MTMTTQVIDVIAERDPRVKEVRWADPVARFDDAHLDCQSCFSSIGWSRDPFGVEGGRRWRPVTVVFLAERALFLICDACNNVSLLEAGPEDDAATVAFGPGEGEDG